MRVCPRTRTHAHTHVYNEILNMEDAPCSRLCFDLVNKVNHSGQAGHGRLHKTAVRGCRPAHPLGRVLRQQGVFNVAGGWDGRSERGK